jgi:uncharacterized protein (TIGR02001 family)
MKLTLTGVTGVLLLMAQAAQSEVTITGTGVTDYDFRGIDQSDGPALQISIDYAADKFYASAWGSNIDFGEDVDANVEVDLLAGFAGETKAGLRWDFGTTWYTYPGSDTNLQNPADETDDIIESPDYWEFYAGGGYGPVDVKYWYSPDLYRSDDSASYVEANASFELPAELSLNLHAGYSFGDYFDGIQDALSDPDPDNPNYDPGYNGDDADYYDYSVGLGRSFGHFDFELKYVNTVTKDYFEVDSGALANDGRVILSVATTIPWSKEEQ